MIRPLLAGVLATLMLVQPAQAKGFIAVSTRNAGPMVSWYRTTFGLQLIRTVRPENANLTVTILDGPLATVEILAKPDLVRMGGGADQRVGIFKTGFEVSDLNAWVTRWRATGVDIAYGPFDEQQPAQRSVILRDPDGNLIHLFQPLTPG